MQRFPLFFNAKAQQRVGRKIAFIIIIGQSPHPPSPTRSLACGGCADEVRGATLGATLAKCLQMRAPNI